MRWFLLVLVLATLLLGCHASRPVTYTSTAIYSVTCSAVAGAKLLGTTPGKLTVTVDAELTATTTGDSGRSVTPVAGKSEGAASHTARIEMEIDPATVHCDGKQPSPRFWLNSETGELTTTAP